VGASGSGKSTLLGLIAGLSHPDEGTVVFDGRDVGHLGEADRARLRSTRIGVVLQTGNLVPFLTAMENVELAIELGGRSEAKRGQDLLVELGLSARLHHRPARLSGGEAQRVSLAMAFAKQPDLLLADEVTGELDTGTAHEVMEVIFGRSRSWGLTVLFVTHDRELADRAEHRLRLADGEVIEA
jgi:putative ABC transport system ATP-binding protein